MLIAIADLIVCLIVCIDKNMSAVQRAKIHSLLVTYRLSCTVSKLWLIIGKIFVIDMGMPHFNAPLGFILCEYPDKLYLSRN